MRLGDKSLETVDHDQNASDVVINNKTRRTIDAQELRSSTI